MRYLAIALLFGSLLTAPLMAAEITYRFVDSAKESARTWYVPRIPGDTGQSVKVDGKLDDAFWKTSPRITDFVDEVGEQGRTSLQLGYDSKYLYLGVSCETSDATRLVSKAPAGARDERVWGGHCIDFKVGLPGKTFQFLVAPNGALVDMEDGNRTWNAPCDVKTTVTAKAYVVEMRITYGAFHFPRDADGRWLKLAFGRATPDEQLQTWSRPYGVVEHAPKVVLGTQKNADQVQSARFISRKTTLMWSTDREEFSTAVPSATGRVRIVDLGGERLRREAALQFAVTDGKRDLISERIYPIDGRLFDYDVKLSALKPGAYTAELRLMDGDEVFDRVKRRLVVEASSAPRSGQITLSVPACPAALPAWPVTFGVPFPEGALDSDEHLLLTDAAGREIAMQTKVTGRWSRGGTVRWVLVDAVIPVRTTTQQLTLDYGPDVRREPSGRSELPAGPQGGQPGRRSDGVSVSEGRMPDGRSAIRIESKRLKAWVPRTNTPGIIEVQADGSRRFRADAGAGPYLIDEAGTVYYGSLDPQPEVVVEDAGPVKACVRVKGWHVSQTGQRLGKFLLTYRIYAGVPHVFMDHTFIITADSDQTRYRDIGYAVSDPSGQGVFGAPRLVPFNLTGADDNAYLLQRDDLYGKVVMNGRFHEEFGRAEGWVSAGGTAVSVRDFWQNFPKEIEVAPNRLTVHFWPGHAEGPFRTGERLNARNAYQCWFAHEGPLLDFKAPDEVVQLVKRDGTNFDGLLQANAMGLAKTHHLLFQFHDGNWDRARVRSTHRVFDLQPTAVPDPGWVCASGAFGRIAPRRPGHHVQTEQAIDGLVARFSRQQAEDRDYGMWNFGDAHHNWIWHERRWRLYRTWRATHHSWPRWPWLQFARSGSFDTLRYARRNAYHVADISHCHYSDDAFRTAKYPRGKMVGGICDYKGLVHWCAGNRFGYNSVADVLLQHYYLTGDLRARDTATAHGQALLDQDRSTGGREGSARLMSLLALYQHTWDNHYLKLIDRHIEALTRESAEEAVFVDESTASRATHDLWTPAFLSYVDLSGADRGKAFIAQWADYLTRVGDAALFGHQAGIEGGGSATLAHLTYGWRVTGDPRYLGAAATRNRQFTSAHYAGDDPRFHNAPVAARRNMPLSFWLTDVGYYLGALDDYGQTPPKWEPPARPRIASLWEGQVDGQRRKLFYARIRQRQEGPFRIRVFVSKRSHVAELKPVTGGPVLRTTAKQTTRFKSMETIELDVPADDCLEYAFRLHTDEGYALIPLPVAIGQEGLQEVYPIRTSGRSITIQGGHALYFDLPAQSEYCRVVYQGEKGHRMIFRNGEGQVVHDRVSLQTSGRTEAILEVTGSRLGWSLHYSGDEGAKCTVHIEEIRPDTASRPMWLSVGPQQFFWPAVDAIKWD